MSNDESMTPDQFFDELDKIFGSNDGYIHHLQRIKDLKRKMEEAEEQLDEQYSFSYFKQVKELQEENKKLKEENKKLEDWKEEIKRLIDR